MPLSVKTLHSKIEERETNAIYYLLRKFRILKETINIQEDLTITGKYGKYKWTTSTGKLDITDCEPTTNYKIIFSILNTDTKAVRTAEADSDVSSSNIASITIPTLQSNEILQTNVNVEITYPQYITQNPYQITVTADKPIIQADETSTLTAQLTHNGSAVTGKTLSYKILHGSTVIDSGSDTTNNQGKITITYTGTAVGEVDLVISYGMLLQETFVIRDSSFVDIATDGKKNNYWNASSCTALTYSTGTTVTETTNGASYLVSTVSGGGAWSSRRFFDVDFAIEFDVESVTGTKFVFYGVTGTPQITLADGHYLIRVTSDKVEYSKDGGAMTTLATASIESVNMGFNDASSSSTMSFKYKNYCIYPV